jgi:hypothetical protein
MSMNHQIIQSLNDLANLSKTKPGSAPSVVSRDIKPGLFYCFDEDKYYEEFPEVACFADTEWQCSNEGAYDLTPDLSVTIKVPYSCQFIGLSGKYYLWVRDRAEGQSPVSCRLGAVIRTIVVHNMAADRPMFRESSEPNTNYGPNFFCTMSAHLLCAGLSDQQSFYYREGQTGNRAGSLKNLIDVYNFWSAEPYPKTMEYSARRGTAEPGSKKIRNIFYKGTASEIDAMFPELMAYGLEDVRKVSAIFTNLYPAWLDSLPSVESQYFYLKRAKVNYSLPSYYKEWFLSTEAKYQAIKAEIRELIKANTQDKLNEFILETGAVFKPVYKIDSLEPRFLNKARTKILKRWDNPWLLNQELNPEFKKVIQKWNEKYPAVSWEVDSKGIPAWYSKCDHSPDSPICQLLMDITYNHEGTPCPVSYDPSTKFVYKAGSGALSRKIVSPKKGLNTKDNCGSVLSKDFIPLWESGVLSTQSPIAKQVVEKMSLITYWTSVRSRLAELV